MSIPAVLLALVLPVQAVSERPASSSPSGQESFEASFGECVVRYKARQARQFVLGRGSPPVAERCLRGEWAQVSFLETTFRYMLARSLLKLDYFAGVPDGIATLGEVSVAPLSAHDKADPDAIRRLSLADCVVRRAPAESFLLTQTEAGTPAAKPLMDSLAPALAACSIAASVRYPRGFQMQEAVVTRLYQLAYAARKPNDA